MIITNSSYRPFATSGNSKYFFWGCNVGRAVEKMQFADCYIIGFKNLSYPAFLLNLKYTSFAI